MSVTAERCRPRLTPAAPEPENEVKLSFFEHLSELRKRLLRAVLGIAVGMARWAGSCERHLPLGDAAPVLRVAAQRTAGARLHEHIEPIMVYLKVALYGGIFVAAPWVLWQIWLFIAPGALQAREAGGRARSSLCGHAALLRRAPPSATAW